MRTIEVKVARIGNSRGIRIPAATLRRYGVGASVIMEERSDGILLRPPGPSNIKLSWEDTAAEMALEEESWSDWDQTAGDGMEEMEWQPEQTCRVAEPKRTYRARKGNSGR